jgi:DNA-directed RNA polymerase specialized sigma24 family protein
MTQHTAELQRHIRRRFPWRIESEVVVQEAYLRAWPKYGADVPLPVLRTIADRVAANMCRRNCRETHLAGDVAAPPDRQLPHWPIEKLPAEQRQVIELRYWQRLSERAAADQLGITRHRLRKVESAALEALRLFASRANHG